MSPSIRVALLFVTVAAGCGGEELLPGVDGDAQPGDLAVEPGAPDLSVSPDPIVDFAGVDLVGFDLTAPPRPNDMTPVSTSTLPSRTGAGTFVLSGRTESAIRVVVPSPLPANPPLVIAFHGTGDEPSGAISDSQLETNATKYGFVAIAPRAGYRNGIHPGDVDHEPNSSGSSWNMWNPDPATNEDLRYVVALINSAHAAYNVDTSRVYTVGFSNGAFMSWFVAASLPSTIAGFGEASGGWTTNACPTRYDADSNGLSFYPTSGPAPGVSVSCATLYASTNPKFPSACIPTATNLMRPPRPSPRTPFGYLAHYTSDDIVSVAWSCYLATSMGARAQITLRWSDSDGTNGHNAPPDFFDKAWTFWAGRNNTQ